MKTALKIASVLMGLIAISGCFKRGDMKVMSMYIPSHDSTNNQIRWEDQQKSFTSLVKRNNPDLIGMQNTNKVLILSLILNLPDYQFAGEKSLNMDANATQNPIFFKKDQFDLIARSQININSKSASDSLTSPEYVTWIKLRSIKTNHIFYLFNAAFNDTPESNTTNNTELFLQNVKMIAGNAPVIITSSLTREQTQKIHDLFTLNDVNEYSFMDANTKHKKNNSTNVNDSAPSNYIFINGYYDVRKFHKLLAPRDGVLVCTNDPAMASISFTNIKRQNDKTSDLITFYN